MMIFSNDPNWGPDWDAAKLPETCECTWLHAICIVNKACIFASVFKRELAEPPRMPTYTKKVKSRGEEHMSSKFLLQSKLFPRCSVCASSVPGKQTGMEFAHKAFVRKNSLYQYLEGR